VGLVPVCKVCAARPSSGDGSGECAGGGGLLLIVEAAASVVALGGSGAGGRSAGEDEGECRSEACRSGDAWRAELSGRVNLSTGEAVVVRVGKARD